MTIASSKLDDEQLYNTFDIDAELEDLLRPLKPGQGLEIALKNGLTLPSLTRRLESAARRVLQKRLRFSYRSDGKAVRFKVTDIHATDYGRRNRRYQRVDRGGDDSPPPTFSGGLRVKTDTEGIVTNVSRVATLSDGSVIKKRTRRKASK